MILLFLDDMKERHERFDEMAGDHEVWHAWDAEQAQKRLSERVYDIAFLDHDLSAAHYEDYHANRQSAAAGTGQEVAHYIVKLPPDRRPRCVLVHSWNPIGADAMARTLRDAGVPVTLAPFGNFKVAGAQP